MKISDWPGIKGLIKLVATPPRAPEQQAERIVAMQLHIVLPIKAGLIVVMSYFLFFSGLSYGPSGATGRQDILETMQQYFPIYVLCNVVGGLVFSWSRRFPPPVFQWLVFTLGLVDGLFMMGVTFLTGGFASVAYLMFPALIVLNAISIPLGTPQIVLNLLLSVFYLSAGVLDARIPFETIQTTELLPSLQPRHLAGRTNAVVPFRDTNRSFVSPLSTNEPSKTNWIGRLNPSFFPYGPFIEEKPAEPFLAQLFVLWLLAACCYGVQVLAERERQATEVAREFALREGQLHSAGRLAAEIAHQIKNPLAIINNAVFSMQRALREGRQDVSKQLEIIREEIERSDKIVTQIMGYAQLSEGRVEKLDLTEELDTALQLVFPPAAGYGIQVEHDYGPHLPPMLMQRRHLAEIFGNILQNAREALNGNGKVSITATCRSDASVEVVISDNGPGIPPDKVERIFEAYYTTREKGTGLGLAIVKHNVELYGGNVQAESELGKGARFILTFPAKAVVSLPK